MPPLKPLLTAIILLAAAPAHACPYGDCPPILKTTLIDLRRDTPPAFDLQRTRFQGYELADGRFQSFSRWYAGRFAPIRADLITQITPNVALLWGVTTGERGEKYTLQPGVRAGIVTVHALTLRTSLSLTARTTLGGRLKEVPCTADYGEIGGVQRVNCRLAAADIAPEATLTQLWNFAPADQHQLTLRLTTHF